MTNAAIYGYVKDPNDKNKWQIDPEAAVVVRRIFQMTIEGKGAYQIARMMYCGACGRRMYNHRGSHADKWDSQDSYACTQYSKYPPKCTMHYIKTSEARQLVLEAIKTVSDFVRENEKEFVKIIREENDLRHEADSKSRQKQLDKNRKRYEELNGIIKRLFEESAAGKITGKRFEILSLDYEKEQEELEQSIAELQAGLERYEANGEKAKRFIKIVKKYTDFSELTPEMLNEYIEKIVVYEAERVNHRRKQKVEIYLNFIGRFTLPNQAEPDEEPCDPVEEKCEKKRAEKSRQTA